MDQPSQIEGELPLEAQGSNPRPAPPAPHLAKSYASNSGGDEPAAERTAGTQEPVRAVRDRRRFAGLTYSQLALMAAALAAGIWGMWATAKIFALEDRRVVSVRLAAIVNDFVTAEARSGTPPDQLTARTRSFMIALDSVLKKRAEGGQIVLVGEAVVAASVPDVTMEVVADLAQLVKMSPPAAMPPAMAPPIAPTVMPQAAPAPDQIAPSAPEPSPGSPFGEAP